MPDNLGQVLRIGASNLSLAMTTKSRDCKEPPLNWEAIVSGQFDSLSSSHKSMAFKESSIFDFAWLRRSKGQMKFPFHERVSCELRVVLGLENTSSGIKMAVKCHGPAKAQGLAKVVTLEFAEKWEGCWKPCLAWFYSKAPTMNNPLYPLTL